MKEYVSMHGCLPPRSFDDPGSDVALRLWLLTLRKKHELGTLSPEMTAALDEALGDVWKVRHHLGFSNILSRVKAFQQSNRKLPQHLDVDANGVKIGSWVQNQRDKHNAGRLSAEHVAALERLSGWTWRYFVRNEVDVWVVALMAFQKANDRLPKQKESWDGFKIGQWVNEQRKAYYQGRLSPEVIASLEAVPGWVWRLRNKRINKIPFEAGLANLLSFVQAHRRLPKHREVGGVPDQMHLGVWVGNCRTKKKQGRLTPDQTAALEQVPGWWWEKPAQPFRLW